MPKKRRNKKKNLDRFRPKVHGPLSASFSQVGQLTSAEFCKLVEETAETVLRSKCLKKEFGLEAGNCAAGGTATSPVDLVVLIDTSGSMQDEASDLSTTADEAIQRAAQNCPSDLRVVWFGIGKGTLTDTNFTEGHSHYLANLGVPNTEIISSHQEDGAAAIIDLANHFDWRPGAGRAIFFLGDEALARGDPQEPEDVAAANAAIAAAVGAGVKVFTYFGTPDTTAPNTPITIGEYARLANDTGGQAFVAPVSNIGGFGAVLETIICASNEEACRQVSEPNIVPCFRLRWGDGPDDRVETNDTEILCITVCNPYSNVVLRNFTLQMLLAAPGVQPIPNLPDGTPSVEVRPEMQVCFGDIPPCDPQDSEKVSCRSREFMFRSRGALAGEYSIHLVYCFEACFALVGGLSGPQFKIDLVQS